MRRGSRSAMMKKILALVLAHCLIAGCATAPYTGRSQMILVSEGQESALGDDAYRQSLRDNVVTHDAEAERIVRKVGERIASAANKPAYKWEFTVINDPETVNAYAVPGGKVAVYTGIFGPARDEAGLAVVLGHEVAHALARHPAERMSQGMLLQLGGVGLGVALGRNPALANQVLQVYGLGAGVGVALPFSRAQESEADHIGLILMAKAGYDPRTALNLWQRMALSYYRSANGQVELLPSAELLDNPTAKAERALLKRLEVINRFVRSKMVNVAWWKPWRLSCA